MLAPAVLLQCEGFEDRSLRYHRADVHERGDLEACLTFRNTNALSNGNRGEEF